MEEFRDKATAEVVVAAGKRIAAPDGEHAAKAHARIIQRKRFLKRVHLDFYRELARRAGAEGPIVELGSGGGGIKEVIPAALTSDVVAGAGVDRVFSALAMPFGDESVGAFVMLDVLHHLPEPRAFFREAVRCLKPGGKVVMIEPAYTVWSRFVYTHFHHEAFVPQAGWELDKEGPLSQSNQARAWIIFHRDREIFAREFPALEVVELRLHSPWRYILSGGLSRPSLAPGWLYPAVRGLEWLLRPANGWLALFETIDLRKTQQSG